MRLSFQIVLHRRTSNPAWKLHECSKLQLSINEMILVLLISLLVSCLIRSFFSLAHDRNESSMLQYQWEKSELFFSSAIRLKSRFATSRQNADVAGTKISVQYWFETSSSTLRNLRKFVVVTHVCKIEAVNRSSLCPLLSLFVVSNHGWSGTIPKPINISQNQRQGISKRAGTCDRWKQACDRCEHIRCLHGLGDWLKPEDQELLCRVPFC